MQRPVKRNAKRRQSRLHRRPRERFTRLLIESLESRCVLSSDIWIAVFRNFAVGGTLEDQARLGQTLFANYGVLDEQVRVLQALGFGGSFVVQTPDGTTEEGLEEALENIPGFAFVEEFEEVKLEAGVRTPGGSFSLGIGLDETASEEPTDPLPPTGTWTNTTNAPTGIGTMMLLSDGTVLAQGGGVTNNWYKLTPSPTLGYVGGTWSQVSSMGLQRLYGGSNVLPDGRVVFIGGEYTGPAGDINRINTGEIYDPVANTWAAIAPFPKSTFGDGQSEILPDGRILAGYLSNTETYIFDPATNTWSAGGSKLHGDRNNEETWNLLPDGSVLVYDIFSSSTDGVGHSQRYIPATNTWIDAGDLPVVLSSSSLGSEMGPALLLPDGRVFMIGANNKTALYTPATDTTPQSWAAGPLLPTNLGADDAPGAIMPNGHVIFAVDTSVPKVFTGPTRLFEFDPVTNGLSELTGQAGFPTQLTTDLNHAAYQTRMLMLPTGQMLFAPGSSNRVYVFNPDGGPDPSWRPTIASIVSNNDGSYTLIGTQLNGISEGASYGDDAEMLTNFPIVQLTNSSTGNVYYGRTFNWSNTGVATGSLPVTTQFTLPPGLPAGSYLLAVIANGIASAPVAFGVPLTVASSNPAAGSVILSSPPTSYVINFSSGIDPISLQASDFLVNGVPASGVALDGTQTSATFSYAATPVVLPGVQSMAIAAGSISADGNPSSTMAAHFATFRYDSPVLAVASTVPAANGVINLPSPLSIVVNFNEPIAPNSLSTDDLSVTVGTVSSVTATGPSQATYLITNITTEGSITITLGAGKVTDVSGNPNSASFSASYTIDHATAAFPVPLIEKSPAGSLIYDASAPGIMSFSGDVDTFTIAVDPAQTITLVVMPTSSGLQPSVQLVDPSNVQIDSATAVAANQPAVIQTAGPTTGGTYRIVVNGAGGSTGKYTLQVVLNAAIENEGVLSGIDNNSIANAQDISSSFAGIAANQSTVSRGAVTGRTGYSATSVPFTFTDISISGAVLSSLTGQDTAVGSATIPFTFNIYGSSFTTLFINSNGLMTFGSSTTSGSNNTLAGNPTQAAISPFWDDLKVTNTVGSGGANTATVRTQTMGSAPNRRFIIQWDKVTFVSSGSTTDPITFQAILNEGTNTIGFNYLDLVSGTAGGNDGASATVGIKKANATDGQSIELSNNSGPNIFVGTGKSTLITPADTFDYYKFALNAGETATIGLAGQTTGTWNLDLRNSSDTVLQTGVDGTNLIKVINSFVASTADTYYVRVSSDTNVPYNIVITKNAAFDTEPNDAIGTAQSFAGNSGALGSSAQLIVAPAILATTDGNYSNAYPFNIGDASITNMRYQQIFARSEFAQSGTITAIRFRRDATESTFTTNGIDVQINLGYSATTFASPSTTFANNVGPGTTTVLDTNSLTLSSSSGTNPRAFDIIIPLTTPFTYDPRQGDLLMDVFMRSSPVTRDFDASNSNQETTTRRIYATNVSNTTGTLDSTFTGLITRFDMASNEDWYSFSASALDSFRLETSTPADGANQFANTLNPHMELYDPSNALVATGAPLADGRNEAIFYTALTNGTYRVRITTEGGTAGEYFFSRSRGLYWDPDGDPLNNNVATGAGLGGTGTWDTTSAQWFNGTADIAWNNANNDVAVFLGTKAGGTAGPVTLGAPITAATISVNTNGYNIQSNTLTVASGQIVAGSGVTATISSQLSGSAGLTTNGAGTVVLSNSANNYTGATTIAAGTLKLGASNAIPATSPVSLTNVTGVSLNLNGLADTIGSLAGGGTTGGNVVCGSGMLTIGGLNTSTTFSGSISGSGCVLTKNGTGTLTLGNTSNSYSGQTIINAGTLGIASVGSISGTSGVLLGSDSPAVLAYNSNGGNTGKTITINGPGGGTIREAQSGGTLTLSGAISTNGNPLTLDVNGGTITASGSIGGSGSVTKIGNGTLTLSGTFSYGGATLVSAGKLLVNSTISSTVAVANGGTLGGSGTINSANTISLDSGGHLAPGTSPGVLNSGSIGLTSGSIFDVELTGVSQYDQQNVTGGVTLGGATLSATLGFTPAVGNTFTIINNDTSDDAVSGAFSGLPEGRVFIVKTGLFVGTFQITYQGGDGNDVVLTAINADNPTLNGTPGDDDWLIALIGANAQVTLNGSPIASTVFANLTGITINGLAGNDTLTIDLSAGDVVPNIGGISFDGGTQTSGDKLVIRGGSQGTVTYNYSNAHDGNIVMDSFGTVRYTGLEPIVNSGTASDIIFNLPAGVGTNTVTFNDDGIINNSRSRLSGATFEQTDFANPTNSLTINRGDKTDSVTVNDLPNFDAVLKIGSASSPFSSIAVEGAVALTSNRTVSLAAQNISTPASLSTTGGNITLAASNDIIIGGLVSSGGGEITITADTDEDGEGTFTIAAGLLPLVGSGSLVGGTGIISISTPDADIHGSIFTSNRLTINPPSGHPIDLGTNSSGALGLTDDELDFIAASTLQIGNSDSGNITFSNVISLASVTTLSLITGGAIVDGHDAPEFLDLEVPNLAMCAVNGIAATVLDLHVDTVAAVNSSSGSLQFAENAGGGNLTVGTVDGISGVTNSAPAGVGSQVRNDGGNLIVNQNITVNGDLDVQAFGITSILSNNAAIRSSAGSINLVADRMALENGTVAADAGGQIMIAVRSSGRPINLGATQDLSGELDISDAELNTIATSGALRIGNLAFIPNVAASANGDITVTAPINVANNFIAIPTLILLTGDSIIDGSSSGNDLTASSLNLTASEGIGAPGNPLEIAAVGLTTDSSGADGDQFLSEADTVNLSAGSLTAGTGTITISGGTFALTASEAIADTTKIKVDAGRFALGTNSDTIAQLILNGGSVTGAGGVLTSTNTIDTRSGSISAILVGNAGLTQSTTGITTLSGANAYSGDTTISSGTLKLGASNVIPDGNGNGNVLLNPVAGSATLDLAGFSETINGLSSSGTGNSFVDNSVSGGPFTFTVGNDDESGTFNGVLKNTAGKLALTKIGSGTLTLGGANNYSGDTTISAGTLKLGRDNAVGGLSGGNLVFNPSSDSATFDLAGFNDRINGVSNSGAGASIIDNTVEGSAILYVGGNGASSTFGGTIQNSAGSLTLSKSGTGTLTLTGSSTHSSTNVSGGPPGTYGILVVKGSLSGSVLTQGSGILYGTGTIGEVFSSGELWPTDGQPNYSPSVLNTGNATLSAGTFVSALKGLDAGTGYTQLNVTGTVTIQQTSLNLLTYFAPDAGTTFTIIEDTGGVTGSFTGLPEGQVFFNLAPYQITYQGSASGHDVVLTALDNTNPTIQGTPGDDTFVIRRNGDNDDIFLNGQVIWSPLISSLSSLSLDSLAGNDSLTVDLSAGNVFPNGGISFNGGEASSSPGDQLSIVGGSQRTVTYNYTDAHDGSIVMSNFGTLRYTDLESITNSGEATDDVFNLPLTDDAVSITDNGSSPGDGVLRLISSPVTLERTDFAIPSGSLTINASAGSDTITIAGAPQLTSALTINGGVGDDTINLNTDITFATDKSLEVNLQNDEASPGLDSVALGTNANLIFSGSGAATIRASRNIRLTSGSSIETVNGPIILEANQQQLAASGNFSGVLVEGAVLKSTGAGVVTVKGRGGDSSSGSQFGVQVSTGGLIQGGLSGALTMSGTGGNAGGSNNSGVRVVGTGSLISSAGADVSVTGFGGTGGSGIRGVTLFNGGQIASGGSGALVVRGTGGAGTTDSNHGVNVDGVGSAISASSGSALVVGFGRGSGTSRFNVGINVVNGGAIQASGNANLTVTGTGGAAATGDSNIGVNVTSGGSIQGSASGQLTLTGTGGSASTGNSNIGVNVKDLASLITSDGGTIEVHGFGGGTALSSSNSGVDVLNGGSITGPASGILTVTGSGGTTSGNANEGVIVGPGSGSQITSAGADIMVIGFGGDGGSFNRGVIAFNGGQITSGGLGQLNIQGTGGPGTIASNEGIDVEGIGSTVGATSGDVTLVGIGGGSAASLANPGVAIYDAGLISAGGTGALHITGTGGNPATNSAGVTSAAGTSISSANGDIRITGSGSKSVSPAISVAGSVISTAGGNIFLLGDVLTIDPISGSVVADGRIVTLLPKTAGRPIDLGLGAVGFTSFDNPSPAPTSPVTLGFGAIQGGIAANGGVIHFAAHHNGFDAVSHRSLTPRVTINSALPVDLSVDLNLDYSNASAVRTFVDASNSTDLEFDAGPSRLGSQGNDIVVNLTKANRHGQGPLVLFGGDNNNTVSVTLDISAGTTAQEFADAINNDAFNVANEILVVVVTNPTVRIDTTPISTIQLTGGADPSTAQDVIDAVDAALAPAGLPYSGPTVHASLQSGSGSTIVALESSPGTAKTYDDVLLSGSVYTSVLGLTDSSLNKISAGTIQIGDSNSGPIAITAPINRPAGSATAINISSSKTVTFSGAGSLDAQHGDVTIQANAMNIGAITTQTSATNITAATINLSADGGIGTTSGSLRFVADHLATDSGNSDQFLAAGGSVTIDDGDLNAGAGTIALTSGAFITTATGSILSAVVVMSGATLGGVGTVPAITVQSGGHVAPGTSPGILTSGKLTLGQEADFDVEINGSSPGNDYDQQLVTDRINLDGAALNVSMGYIPSASEAFRIIDNDSENDVAGAFKDLPEGSLLTVTAQSAVLTLTITYQGGDGNDVVLTVLNFAPTLDAILDPSAIDEDAEEQSVQLTSLSSGDVVSAVAMVTAVSSNSTLIPDPKVTYSNADGTGTLTYRPLANEYGEAVITVTVKDDGGTVAGGMNTLTLTFIVVVNPVNDLPTFNHLTGDYSAADENPITNGPALEQVIPFWATNISAGPENESHQVPQFVVTTDNDSLFAIGPAVGLDGMLSYTPMPNAHGTAHVAVTLRDNGGGADTSSEASFQITITKTHQFHNAAEAGARNGRDVTGSTSVEPDGFIVAGDALAVINYINANGSGSVLGNIKAGPPYPDVDADDHVVAQDVVDIINYINAHPGQSEASDESTTLPASSTAIQPPIQAIRLDGASHDALPLQALTASSTADASTDLINLLAADVATTLLKRRRTML